MSKPENARGEYLDLSNRLSRRIREGAPSYLVYVSAKSVSDRLRSFAEKQSLRGITYRGIQDGMLAFKVTPYMSRGKIVKSKDTLSSLLEMIFFEGNNPDITVRDSE